MPTLTKAPKEEPKKDDSKEITKSDKRMNGVIIGLVATALALITIISLVIFVPALSKEKEIVVPDVSNMSVVDAEKKLKDLGFTISVEPDYKPSDRVNEGDVLGTSPVSGVSRKEGTEITLIISSGEEGIIVENYIGKNYYEVKGMLEANGIVVTVEKKEVEDKELTENTIIEQYPEVGTKVIKGATVKLIVPDVITKYPNFVSEGWTVEDIQIFCDEYGLTLTVVEEETSMYPAGRVIKQSRNADSRVIAGVSLKITIAKEPTIEEAPITPDEPTEESEGSN